MAPIDLTPEQRQRNVIDPRALPSALAAQGGYFNNSHSSGWGGGGGPSGSGYLYDHDDENRGPGITQRIGAAIGNVGSAVGDALGSLTTTTKTKAAGFNWPGQGGSGSNDKSSYTDYDVNARINNLKNLNQTINLHTIQTEAEIYATDPRGGDFPGQMMLSTAASSMGRAVSSATDTPSKRRRLCLVIVASAAIITALTVGTTTDVASDIANHLPTLPTLGGGFGSGSSLKDLQRTESNPRFASIRTRILHAGVSDPEVLSTPTEWPPSPQYQAVQWLAEGDARQVHPDDEYIIQRYALATFWISTYGRVVEENELEHSHHYGNSRRLADEEEDGLDDDKVEDEMWLRRKNWMTKHGICSWEGVQCHHRPGGTHEETHYDEVSLQKDNSTRLLYMICVFSQYHFFPTF